MPSNLRIAYQDIADKAVDFYVDPQQETEAAFRVENLHGRGSQQFFKLSSNLRRTYVAYDMGVGNTDTIDALILGRADRLQSNAVEHIAVTGHRQRRKVPTEDLSSIIKLHLNGNAGVTIDSSRRVSAWADKSGGTDSATQSTDANKPWLTRSGNRENLQPKSEDFTVYTKSRVTTVTANAIANPVNGAVDADQVVEDSTNGQHLIHYRTCEIRSGETYVYSIYAKANGRNLTIQTSVGFATGLLHVNLSDGTITSTGSPWTNSSIADLGSGWYKISAEATANSSSSTGGVLLILNQNTPPDFAGEFYTGDGSSGFYLWGAQMRHEDADDVYLANDGLKSIFRGHNGNRGVYFPGSSEYLELTGNLNSYFDSNGRGDIYISFVSWSAGSSGTGDDNDGIFSTASQDFGVMVNNSPQVYSFNDDGANDAVQKPTSHGTHYVVRVTHDATNLAIALDEGSLSTTTSGATSDATQTVYIGANGGLSRFLNGTIFDIVVTNTQTTSAQDTAITQMLVDKLNNTPIFQDSQLDTETLAQSPHHIEVFSESSSYRNFNVVLSKAAGADYEMSSLTLCKLFDFGRDPHSASYSQATRQGAVSFETTIDEHHFADVADQLAIYTFTWRNVTDANLRAFETELLQYKDRNSFWLYADSDTQILLGKTLVQVTLESATARKEFANANEITAIFREAL